ncbi:hypothetical protein OOZ15_06285 [Galbibacter sp. EGI 63066]|uniref:hypothetical protein n=1 Tax=Galbibacter sp. EGI 63066 TaxID=2993559 RepID=UPI00224998FE|nr:hypothetical protein [Galbibacter sp. EGI 63066]MCX2679547.1 hypothetical protein [Galbibacter sp. EGI 63066]
MISIITLLIFTGFYALYSTSKRAVLNKAPLDLWLQQKGKFLKPIGIFLLCLAAVLIILDQGFASGLFFWFIILMTLGSLIVLLSPLKLFSYKTLLIVFLCLLTTEIFIL